jgi:selenocysteine lyase/cysteine desulfurase
MDIERLRGETPGIATCVNLNNAGTALMPRPVIEAQRAHLELEAEIGGQAAAAERAAQLEAVYVSLATLLGTRPETLALTMNATHAWQLAFYGIGFEPGDRIVTSRAEYGANYVAFLQMQKRSGLLIDVIPDDESGASDPAALEDMIDERVKLIALTWVPTNGGLVNPAEAIGEVARRHAIPYLLDACQAVGQMPVNVEDLQCDFLTGAGRKWLRGPRGTGFLYVHPGMLEKFEPGMIDHTGTRWTAPERYELQPTAKRYESYERATGLQLGLGAAVDYALEIGLEPIRGRVRELAWRLREELAKLPGVRVRDIGVELCGIATFDHKDVSSSTIRSALGEASIQVAVATPDGALLDARARGLADLVRVSPHYYNTEAELQMFLDRLEQIIGESRAS